MYLQNTVRTKQGCLAAIKKYLTIKLNNVLDIKDIINEKHKIKSLKQCKINKILKNEDNK